MPRLLIVHHTPSPALQEMFEAAVSGARTDEIEGVEVVIRPALTAAAADVLTGGWFLARHAREHWLYVRRAQALLRRHLLPVPGGDQAAALRPVRARRDGHHRRGARGRVDHHRAPVAGDPAAGHRHRASRQADLEACWELGALLAAEVAGLIAAARPVAASLAKLPELQLLVAAWPQSDTLKGSTDIPAAARASRERWLPGRGGFMFSDGLASAGA